MKLPHRLALLLSMSLAACGGGGGNNGASGNEGGVVTAPVPPVTLRGSLIDPTALVPQTAAGATVNTLTPAALSALLNAAQSGSTVITGNPTCSVTVYRAHYHTIGSAAENTDASTAIMVPSGADPSCSGPRPVLLYAHGTSVLKTTDMADLGGTEARLIAAIFASQGYIVVAPNYAGLAGSALPYLPYLDVAQESSDMVDGLRAARASFAAIGAADSGQLYVTGYSQGGHVALATQRAMQLSYPAEFRVAAAAGLSGPYALSLFGDTIFDGAPTIGSAAFVPLLINTGQRAGARIYSATGDIYEDKYATGIDTLFPSTVGIGDLVAAGKLPDDVLFAADSLPQSPGYAAHFGADHLIKSAYRAAYLADMQAHPCGTSNSAPLACAPAQPLRQWLLKNDLRNYTPNVPLLLCGGKDDPIVPFVNADAATAYFSAQGKAAYTLTELNIDATSIGNLYSSEQLAFQAAKLAVRANAIAAGDDPNQAVQGSYHAGLVAPFCLRSARDFFKTF
ncbi:lipase family protein [Rugamonas sp.]|uniref:alpha/beta hydrolase family protein n=1 Tax=Rugamonas sp. TaxID=1926287 RepID=UPI0025F7910D|nr:lipase family protein [Rugamonas sp.]